ncbi:MAG TPA: hypothetical protein VJ065_00480 [Patescibacteria group bacterium]|nr:hypothetical protein [Patescibacteria group bacterium]
MENKQKERILRGDTSVSHSSDEYITGNLRQIQGEVYAVNNSEVDVDFYSPQHIEPTTYSTNVEIGTQSSPLTSAGEPKGADSAFALSILFARIRKLKKPPNST